MRLEICGFHKKPHKHFGGGSVVLPAKPKDIINKSIEKWHQQQQVDITSIYLLDECQYMSLDGF